MGPRSALSGDIARARGPLTVDPPLRPETSHQSFTRDLDVLIHRFGLAGPTGGPEAYEPPPGSLIISRTIGTQPGGAPNQSAARRAKLKDIYRRVLNSNPGKTTRDPINLALQPQKPHSSQPTSHAQHGSASDLQHQQDRHRPNTSRPFHIPQTPREDAHDLQRNRQTCPSLSGPVEASAATSDRHNTVPTQQLEEKQSLTPAETVAQAQKRTRDPEAAALACLQELSEGESALPDTSQDTRELMTDLTNVSGWNEKPDACLVLANAMHQKGCTRKAANERSIILQCLHMERVEQGLEMDRRASADNLRTEVQARLKRLASPRHLQEKYKNQETCPRRSSSSAKWTRAPRNNIHDLFIHKGAWRPRTSAGHERLSIGPIKRELSARFRPSSPEQHPGPSFPLRSQLAACHSESVLQVRPAMARLQEHWSLRGFSRQHVDPSGGASKGMPMAQQHLQPERSWHIQGSQRYRHTSPSLTRQLVMEDELDAELMESGSGHG